MKLNKEKIKELEIIVEEFFISNNLDFCDRLYFYTSAMTSSISIHTIDFDYDDFVKYLKSKINKENNEEKL